MGEGEIKIADPSLAELDRDGRYLQNPERMPELSLHNLARPRTTSARLRAEVQARGRVDCIDQWDELGRGGLMRRTSDIRVR